MGLMSPKLLGLFALVLGGILVANSLENVWEIAIGPLPWYAGLLIGIAFLAIARRLHA